MQTRFTLEALRDPSTAVAERAIRACVHCGFCNATCPTYGLLGDELDGPRGRIMLMKDMLENARRPSAKTVSHIDKCLSCLSCMSTCPSGVNYMHLVDHARAYIEMRYRRPWWQRVLRFTLAKLLPYPRRFAVALAMGRLFAPLRSLVPATGAGKSLRAMLELSRVKSQAPAPAVAASVPTRKGRVALLRGCAEPVLQPQIRAATTRLLARMGYDVIDAPGERCCGALVHHLGREAESLRFARANVDAWSRLIEDGGLDAILVSASGCGTSLKDYGFLLREDSVYASRAAEVSALAQDISEFVAAQGLPAVVAHPKLRVAYQSACSLQHGQRVRAAPRELLIAAGFEAQEPRDAHLCCGSAGVYNILQPDIADALRRQKLEALTALRPDCIASGNIGCMTQLARESSTPLVHTVELLDWATGGPPPAGLGERLT